jgi:xanthine dehydrogenase YagS FAD-binding subunit
MKPFQHIRARNAQQAVELLQQHGQQARILAGGSEILMRMKQGQLAPEYLISLRQVPSLRLISHYLHSNLEIGAFTTLQQIADHPVISSRFSALSEAAQSIGSPQLRHRATIAGNLLQHCRCPYYLEHFNCVKKGGATCPAKTGDARLLSIFDTGACKAVHPSDLATALASLNASVVLNGPRQERSIKLSAFLITPKENLTQDNRLEPGEVITKIVVPEVDSGTRSAFRKMTVRSRNDHALVSVAVALSPESDTVRTARMYLGGAASIPWRAESAELYLRHNPLTEDTIQQAAVLALAGAAPILTTETQVGNEYKVQMAKAMIHDALDHIMNSSPPADYYDYEDDDEYYGYE